MSRITPLLCLIVVSTLFSCKDDVPIIVPTSAFIVGEIANPKTDNVILIDSDFIIDTLQLDNRNRFYKKIDSAKSNIYWFKHNLESQIMFIEPNDSLILRTNTIEFDEALAYSGRGGAKNNFLINHFLNNENTDVLIKKSQNSTPRQFKRVTDSIHSYRLQELDEAREKHNFSDAFYNFAKAGIDYYDYYQNEQYVFLQKKYKEDVTFDESFYNYRDNIDINNESLANFYAFFRVADIYLKNIASENCLKTSSNTACYNFDRLENVHHLIRATDSLLHAKTLRNRFIRRLGRDAILLSVTSEDIKKTKEVLVETNLDPEVEDFFRSFTNSVKRNLIPDNVIGNWNIENVYGKKLQLEDVLKKKNIIYFWNEEYAQRFITQHRRINYLRKEFPDINFIGLFTGNLEKKLWVDILNEYNYSHLQEYRLTLEDVHVNPYDELIPKTVFMDASGKIIKTDARYHSSGFEDILNKYVND